MLEGWCRPSWRSDIQLSPPASVINRYVRVRLVHRRIDVNGVGEGRDERREAITMLRPKVQHHRVCPRPMLPELRL